MMVHGKYRTCWRRATGVNYGSGLYAFRTLPIDQNLRLWNAVVELIEGDPIQREGGNNKAS